MSNMSYCRFENTYNDLLDCQENLLDNDLSRTEFNARKSMIKTMKEMITDWEESEFDLLKYEDQNGDQS